MEKNDQVSLLFKILKRFSENGVLEQGMLIGSWCLHFYRNEFQRFDLLPAIRTLDVDFLIPHPGRIKKSVDIPALLKEEGFVPIINFSNGLVRYQHPDLLLEFLAPELGRGFDKPRDIRPRHIQAAEIRFLNFLTENPKKVRYQGITVTMPNPAVFALHKLIVSSRRAKKEKREKDLSMAVGILELLFKDPKEKKRVKEVLASLPAKWRKIILSVSAKHFPALNSDGVEPKKANQ